MDKDIQNAFDNWEEKTLKPLTGKFPERKVQFATTSGIDVPRVALPGERTT